MPYDLQSVGIKLRALGLTYATAGNISARTETGAEITPTGTDLGEAFDPIEWIIGETPNEDASTEWRVHDAIYAARPDVGAIVHAHPPHAVAWSFIDVTLELLDSRSVRIMTPTTPGTREAANSAVEGLIASPAVILGRHGPFTVGPDLEEALDLMEYVEHSAHVRFLTDRTT